MDKLAVTCAMEHTGQNCVTLFVDQIKFLSPVNVMEVVDMESEVIDEGMTSILIHVKALKRKAVETKDKAVMVAESIFKFVSLDANGKPTDRWAKRHRDVKSELRSQAKQITNSLS
jgi:acyl-CoA hydrolase